MLFCYQSFPINYGLKFALSSNNSIGELTCICLWTVVWFWHADIMNWYVFIWRAGITSDDCSNAHSNSNASLPTTSSRWKQSLSDWLTERQARQTNFRWKWSSFWHPPTHTRNNKLKNAWSFWPKISNHKFSQQHASWEATPKTLFNMLAEYFCLWMGGFVELGGRWDGLWWVVIHAAHVVPLCLARGSWL